ncbi:MAG: right-handed parallel beta-helix repeat-containing protein [Gemmatimonadaceae bacterium]
MRALFLAALLGSTSSSAIPAQTPDTVAELPRVFLDTKMPGSSGTTITVPAGGDLQAALNKAKPCDVIALANGATFSGNFILPKKAGTCWIVIRPVSMTGIPPEGTRMSPAIAAAANLPKILSASNMGAFATADGAHHYRFVALDISVPASIVNTGLVRLGRSEETSLAQMPHDLVLDRMYIHGTATGSNRRCVSLNGASSAVIDSYIADCHEQGGDAQAIAGWSGPGPFKIVNNYLEASGENVMWGGGDPRIKGLIPSDIEMRRNHFFKPTSWKGKWLVKNLFEIKNAQRVLVEGNVFENNWAHGQGGSAIVLKSVNQERTCTWCVAKDITFRLNVIKNTGSGFALTGRDEGTQAPMTRVTITDNVLTGIDIAPFTGEGRGFLINNNPVDLVIAHNTVLDATNSAVTFGGPATDPPVRMVFRDNIISSGLYGVKGPGMAMVATIAAYMPGGFRNNLIITADGSAYPSSLGVQGVGGVGFTSRMDLRLGAGSRFRGRGSDGRDLGADVAAIQAATAGVVVP